MKVTMLRVTQDKWYILLKIVLTKEELILHITINKLSSYS